MAVWAVGVVSPGPDALLVLRQTVLGSRREGVAAAVGIASGIAVWVVLAMLGLEVVLADRPTLVGCLQIAGGVFLAYLGVVGLRSTPVDTAQPGRVAGTTGKSFALGLLTNVTNPKALVFFAAVFATLIPATATAADWVAVAVLFVVSEAVWFSVLAVFASSEVVGEWLRRRARGFTIVAGLVFVLLGGVVVAAGVRVLLG